MGLIGWVIMRPSHASIAHSHIRNMSLCRLDIEGRTTFQPITVCTTCSSRQMFVSYKCLYTWITGRPLDECDYLINRYNVSTWILRYYWRYLCLDLCIILETESPPCKLLLCQRQQQLVNILASIPPLAGRGERRGGDVPLICNHRISRQRRGRHFSGFDLLTLTMWFRTWPFLTIELAPFLHTFDTLVLSNALTRVTQWRRDVGVGEPLYFLVPWGVLSVPRIIVIGEFCGV